MPGKPHFLIAILLLTALLSGCSDNGVKRIEPDESLGDYFITLHSITETPNGRIKVDTVKEILPNTLEYETDDGSKFRIVGTIDQELGGVRWETPEKLP